MSSSYIKIQNKSVYFKLFFETIKVYSFTYQSTKIDYSQHYFQKD